MEDVKDVVRSIKVVNARERVKKAYKEQRQGRAKHSEIDEDYGKDIDAPRTARAYEERLIKQVNLRQMMVSKGKEVTKKLGDAIDYFQIMASTQRVIEECERELRDEQARGEIEGEGENKASVRFDPDLHSPIAAANADVRADFDSFRLKRGGASAAAPRQSSAENALADLAEVNDAIEKEMGNKGMSPSRFYGHGSTALSDLGWRRAGQGTSQGSRQLQAALGLRMSAVKEQSYHRERRDKEEREQRRTAMPSTSAAEEQVRLPETCVESPLSERPTKRRAPSRGKKSEPMVVDLLEESDENDDGEKKQLPPYEPTVDLIGDGQPRRSTRASRYRSLPQLVGNLDAMYPDSAKGATRVALADLDCLKDGEMLNDQCVDFYLKYLQCETLAKNYPLIMNRVHIFNSFFYQKLAQKHDEESTLDASTAAHDRVKTWTKSVDVFSKDFLLIPIHNNLHWSLIVVCNPGGAREPFMLHLDSMLGGHNSASVSATIKKYLDKEWIAQKGESAESPKFTRERYMPTFRPHVPRQQNGCDCGVFILSFVEKFVTEDKLDVLTKDYAKLSTETHPSDGRKLFLRKNWFPPNETADEMRTKVSLLIIQVIADSIPADDASLLSLNEAHQIYARDLDERQSMVKKAESKIERAHQKAELDRLADARAKEGIDEDKQLEVDFELVQPKFQARAAKENVSARAVEFPGPRATPREKTEEKKEMTRTMSSYFQGTAHRLGGSAPPGGLAGKPVTRGNNVGNAQLLERFQRSLAKNEQDDPKSEREETRQKLQSEFSKARENAKIKSHGRSNILNVLRPETAVKAPVMDDDSSDDDKGIALPRTYT